METVELYIEELITYHTRKAKNASSILRKNFHEKAVRLLKSTKTRLEELENTKQ